MHTTKVRSIYNFLYQNKMHVELFLFFYAITILLTRSKFFTLQTAQLMSVYLARYCVENVVDRDELVEVIEDLMDEEFETVCHDDSPKGNFLDLVLHR